MLRQSRMFFSLVFTWLDEVVMNKGVLRAVSEHVLGKTQWEARNLLYINGT